MTFIIYSSLFVALYFNTAWNAINDQLTSKALLFKEPQVVHHNTLLAKAQSPVGKVDPVKEQLVANVPSLVGSVHPDLKPSSSCDRSIQVSYERLSRSSAFILSYNNQASTLLGVSFVDADNQQIEIQESLDTWDWMKNASSRQFSVNNDVMSLGDEHVQDDLVFQPLINRVSDRDGRRNSDQIIQAIAEAANQALGQLFIPITVPSSTLPALGDTLNYSWAYNQATFDMVTPPGLDQTWDFTGLTADESIQEVYLDPSLGQYTSRFPTANLMTKKDSGEERYYQVSASGLKLLGWTENTLFGEPLVVVYELGPSGLNERFTPLNFFDIYSQSTSILEGMPLSDLPLSIRNAYLAAGLTTMDSVRLRFSYSNIHAVDAYGTSIIPGPGQQQFPVLRMKTTQYREGRIDGKVAPLGWLDITDITIQYFPASVPSLGVDTTGAHTFFNDVTKEEIARITLNSQGLPHHVRYKNNSPPSCFNPDLVNATLNDDPITPGNYMASQTITSAGRVATGTTVQFIAGIHITLQPGFLADAGSIFTADVITCPVNRLQPKMMETQMGIPTSFQPYHGKQGIPMLLDSKGRPRIYPILPILR